MAEQYQQQSWFPGYPPQAMYYAPPNTLTGNLGQSLDPMAMQSMQYRQFQQGQMPIGSQGMPNFQATLAHVPKEEEGLKKKKKGAGKPKKKIAKKPKKKPKKKAAKKKKPKKKKPAVDKQAQQKKKRVLEQKKKLAEQAKNKRKQEAEKKKRAKEKEKERIQKQKEKMLTKTGKKRKERDPDAPKRARTAFNFFLDAFREEYKRDHPDAKGVVGVTKAGSERWKSMSDEEKLPFEARASTAREIYQKAKEEYEAQGGMAKFKLIKGPPRPPTAYFVFLNEFRQQYKESHPEAKGIKEMSKEAGEKWRSMNSEDKSPFEVKARAAKDEYQKLKAMSVEERVAATQDCNGKPYARFM
jgi:hypothetical protein